MQAPAAIASLVGSKDDDQGDPQAAVVAASESMEALNSSDQESVFLIGVLDELKIVISNSQVVRQTSEPSRYKFCLSMDSADYS